MFTGAFLLALGATSFASKVVDCSSGSSRFLLNTAIITPTVPKAGDSIKLYIDYTVPPNTNITDGTAEFSITYNYIPFTPTVSPLCANVACPVLSGQYTNETDSVWPSGLSGMISTQMKWYDMDKDLLLCVGISWKSMSSYTDLSKRSYHKYKFHRLSASPSPAV
jgi:hypothetical protein